MPCSLRNRYGVNPLTFASYHGIINSSNRKEGNNMIVNPNLTYSKCVQIARVMDYAGVNLIARHSSSGARFVLNENVSEAALDVLEGIVKLCGGVWEVREDEEG